MPMGVGYVGGRKPGKTAQGSGMGNPPKLSKPSNSDQVGCPEGKTQTGTGLKTVPTKRVSTGY